MTVALLLTPQNLTALYAMRKVSERGFVVEGHPVYDAGGLLEEMAVRATEVGSNRSWLIRGGTTTRLEEAAE